MVVERLEALWCISIHAPRVGSDSWILRVWSTDGDFNPRSPCGERHVSFVSLPGSNSISIHAPRVGSDYRYLLRMSASIAFQSTLPVWGATMRGKDPNQIINISIHAPRVGSDSEVRPEEPDLKYFNPRSPCGERLLDGKIPVNQGNFNPRSPCGERRPPVFTVPGKQHFNPRSPCGERLERRHNDGCAYPISIHAPRVGSDPLAIFFGLLGIISIHAPRVGSDLIELKGRMEGLEFQSTLPVWGATMPCDANPVLYKISIHAPRVGSDQFTTTAVPVTDDFNPRSPCGERLLDLMYQSILRRKFQSTLPVWGATPVAGPVSKPVLISIHAPRVGSDDARVWAWIAVNIFQSTLPVWGATHGFPEPHERIRISIHAPRVGSDTVPLSVLLQLSDFNPRSPCGERLRSSGNLIIIADFNPRSPCGERLIYSGKGIWNCVISIHAPRVGSDQPPLF